MKITMHTILSCLLGLEIITFLSFYFLSENGYFLITSYKNDIVQIKNKIADLKKENSELESSITVQKKHPFFKEKIAREKLQMALTDEEIYLID